MKFSSCRGPSFILEDCLPQSGRSATSNDYQNFRCSGIQVFRFSLPSNPDFLEQIRKDPPPPPGDTPSWAITLPPGNRFGVGIYLHPLRLPYPSGPVFGTRVSSVFTVPCRPFGNSFSNAQLKFGRKFTGS
jgi:hypothetical protein